MRLLRGLPELLALVKAMGAAIRSVSTVCFLLALLLYVRARSELLIDLLDQIRSISPEGSLSAVSKRNFARKYAFESSRRDLHNVAGLFIIILFYFIVIFLFSDPFARRLIIRQIPEDFLVISCGVKIFSVWRWGKDLWHKLFTFGAAWAPRATLPRVWCTAATAKAS